MNIQDLEQVIRDYLRDIYKKEYIGKMTVEAINPIGYKISLGLGVSNRPTIIYAELEDKAFLKFLKQELRDRRFNLIDYGELNLRYPTNCRPENQPCCD